MTTTASAGAAALESFPVGLVPTTPRRHVTGAAALNLPHRWRLGGDWHQSWFGVRPTELAPDLLTDERRFARLLDRLGRAGLRDARPGLALIGHPGRRAPSKVWAATHERAVVETAWARLQRIAGTEVAPGLPPIDREDFYRVLPHPDQWGRVRWWAWRLRAVLTPDELAIWTEWQKEWWP